jgi:hypothetical protein
VGDQLDDINTLSVSAVWCFYFSSAVWHRLDIAVDSQNLCSYDSGVKIFSYFILFTWLLLNCDTSQDPAMSETDPPVAYAGWCWSFSS